MSTADPVPSSAQKQPQLNLEAFLKEVAHRLGTSDQLWASDELDSLSAYEVMLAVEEISGRASSTDEYRPLRSLADAHAYYLRLTS